MPSAHAAHPEHTIVIRVLHVVDVPDRLGLAHLARPDEVAEILYNPSDETYRFPTVNASQSMIKKAAWLLQELVERADGKGGWAVDQELVALQSALFMVGYKVLKEDAIRYQRCQPRALECLCLMAFATAYNLM